MKSCIIFMFIMACFAQVNPYQLQFEDMDDEMGEMYNYEREVEIMEIAVKKTEMKIKEMQDQLKYSDYLSDMNKKVINSEIDYFNNYLKDLKGELKKAAESAIKYHDKMKKNTKERFDLLYNFKDRLKQLKTY